MQVNIPPILVKKIILLTRALWLPLAVKIVVGTLLLAPALAQCETPTYTLEQSVKLANSQNPEIIIARKRIEAARGDFISARAGYLPSVLSNGTWDQREHQGQTRLRNEDYGASVRAQENIYTGGAVSNETAIARLNIEKQQYELQEIENRVAMEVRLGFYELLLNRAKVRVREDSVQVLKQELESQQQRLSAGTVGTLNVRRAEVALANEQPELFAAQRDLQSSYLRLGLLFGQDARTDLDQPAFEVAGQLQYEGAQPDLTESLARADVQRPQIKAREKEVEIADRQYRVDRSELLPHVDVFSAYEVYNERDPAVGPEFNHGYLFGVSGSWHIFDGFATKGKMQATRARREAAVQALQMARMSVASEVRTAFLDLAQAANVLQSETRNVQNADQSLESAKGNLAAGLGTQLDVLQAASDVTRTRTTRLSAIYLHNAALARLAQACATTPDALDFESTSTSKLRQARQAQAVAVGRPPAKLTLSTR